MRDIGRSLRIIQILLSRSSNKKSSGQILHVHQCLVIVRSEMEFGDVNDLCIWNGHSISKGAIERRHPRQHSDRLSVTDEPREFFTNVAGAVYPILLCNEMSAT